MAEAAPRSLLTPGVEGFPAELLDLPDPPARLHVRGRIAAGERRAAIVGSRAATPYGLGFARRLASDLAGLGFTVVSGLARGIDAAAHVGALEAGGRTIAVLPGGLGAITPPGHTALAARIAERGALISEWPEEYPVLRAMFLRRNRLIAALSLATIVVEAAARSGALSTAAVARRLGRACLAVPGDVDRPTSRGCHALIRSGAAVCETASDVLAAIAAADPPGRRGGRGRRPIPGERRPDARATAASLAQRVAAGAMGCGVGSSQGEGRASAEPAAVLLDVLGARPQSLEALASRAGLPIDETLAALLRMEWSGTIAALPGQRWARRSASGS